MHQAVFAIAKISTFHKCFKASPLSIALDTFRAITPNLLRIGRARVGLGTPY